jgi:hypothetical protein
MVAVSRSQVQASKASTHSVVTSPSTNEPQKKVVSILHISVGGEGVCECHGQIHHAQKQSRELLGKGETSGEVFPCSCYPPTVAVF